MKKRRLKQSVVNEFASFLGDVIKTERDPTDSSGARRRLAERSAPSGLGEQVPADGGFLLQSEWADTIITRSYQESAVTSRMTEWNIGNKNYDGLKIPAIDETSRVDGSRWGGLRGYWANEADDLTNLKSKMKFTNVELKPKKFIILAHLTNELMSDMGSLARYLLIFFPKELAFRVTDAAINGDGAGKPQGVINSPAKIAVAAEQNQQAATVNSYNVVNMLKRFWVGSHVTGQGAWFCNSDLVAQLPLMTVTAGAGGSVSRLYDPATLTMMGFPVVFLEQCQALGTEGDIILADFSEYMIAWRNRGEIVTSLEIKFLNDEQTMRLTARVDGAGSWNSAVTPMYGTTTQSPFVTLATRS